MGSELQKLLVEQLQEQGVHCAPDALFTAETVDLSLYVSADTAGWQQLGAVLDWCQPTTALLMLMGPDESDADSPAGESVLCVLLGQRVVKVLCMDPSSGSAPATGDSPSAPDADTDEPWSDEQLETISADVSATITRIRDTLPDWEPAARWQDRAESIALLTYPDDMELAAQAAFLMWAGPLRDEVTELGRERKLAHQLRVGENAEQVAADLAAGADAARLRAAPRTVRPQLVFQILHAQDHCLTRASCKPVVDVLNRMWVR